MFNSKPLNYGPEMLTFEEKHKEMVASAHTYRYTFYQPPSPKMGKENRSDIQQGIILRASHCPCQPAQWPRVVPSPWIKALALAPSRKHSEKHSVLE